MMKRWYALASASAAATGVTFTTEKDHFKLHEKKETNLNRKIKLAEKIIKKYKVQHKHI